MVPYEEAYRMALALKHGRIDHCHETRNAYVFSHSSEAGDTEGPGPCVVIKETGDCLSLIGYLLDDAHEDDEDVRDFDI